MNKLLTTFFLLSCLLGGFSPMGYAQPGGNTLLSLQLKDVFTGAITLDSLTHYMNLHTDARFSFNSGRIKGSRAILFPGKTYDLNSLLKHIQKNTGLSYSFYGKHIIFRDETHPHPPSNPSSPPHDRKPAPHLTATSLTNVPDRPNISSHPVKRTIVRVAPATTIPPGPPLVKLPPSPKRAPRQVIRVSPNRASANNVPGNQQTNDSKDDLTASRWHLQAGLFANEVFYANAGIEAGIKPIHLLFSVGSNFHVTTWHIGLGTDFRWMNIPWQLTAGYSPLRSTIGIDSGQRKINFTVKGQLYEVGISGYKRHGEHWLFRAGTSWNLLRTSYYKAGALIAPDQFVGQIRDPDKTLYLLRPPLLISNTYKSTSSGNTKIWPGLSIGLYYDLNFFKQRKGG